ncbi:hypothetical protein MNBD_NITROSPINAE04-1953 [hydrothermal vent metagenome]|uniref:Mu-like prophage I protein n=1 Tax=hydrothermal vent metagenome TaxID=652676 RepID=A0A3B1BAX0_9ZZZZ
MTPTLSDEPTLIAPIGEFAHPMGKQVIDEKAVELILNQFERWGRDIVVDYRHESMKECGTARAAGWVKTKTARIAENGIEAVIEWTDQAKKLIESKEYRFLSPVFESIDGKITGLLNLGLTNNPNIHVMPPLVNQLPTQEINMEEKELTETLKEKLGLDKEAENSEIIAAVETVLNEKEIAPALASMLGDTLALLGLTPEATNEEIIEKIESLAKESAAGRDEGVERMINDAVMAGKLRPSQKAWARNLASLNPESLRLFIANSGPMVPLGDAITKASAKPVSKLTEDEAAVCALLNINECDYLKYGR